MYSLFNKNNNINFLESLEELPDTSPPKQFYFVEDPGGNFGSFNTPIDITMRQLTKDIDEILEDENSLEHRANINLMNLTKFYSIYVVDNTINDFDMGNNLIFIMEYNGNAFTAEKDLPVEAIYIQANNTDPEIGDIGFITIKMEVLSVENDEEIFGDPIQLEDLLVLTDVYEFTPENFDLYLEQIGGLTVAQQLEYRDASYRIWVESIEALITTQAGTNTNLIPYFFDITYKPVASLYVYNGDKYMKVEEI